MEAVVKTKVGIHRILLRKGLQAVQDCLSGASLTLYSNGTVVSSSGGTFSHIPAS